MLGNGSDGDLYVANGQTVNLNLNHKYQFRNITVEAGGTISTTNTTGAVLYLLAIGKIEISGNIILNNKMNRGHNTWGTTIDGGYYESPGVAPGGYGGYWSGQTGRAGTNGWGGGGSGDGITISGIKLNPSSGGEGGLVHLVVLREAHTLQTLLGTPITI